MNFFTELYLDLLMSTSTQHIVKYADDTTLIAGDKNIQEFQNKN